MRVRNAGVALLLVVGCAPAHATVGAPAATPRTTPIPTPTPPRPPAHPLHFDRTVLFNEVTRGDEAPARVLTDCRTIVGGWTFGENGGDQIWMTRRSDGKVLGFAPPDSAQESATGGWTGDAIHLTGTSHDRVAGAWRDEPLTYDLRPEPGTGHLIGTRDGAPIHLAPTAIQGPDCSKEPPVP